ncbi:MAG: excinuclease ABC subunit UvrC [Desulfobacteraceae bacterium]|jgi:excinuclease ABC subunit C
MNETPLSLHDLATESLRLDLPKGPGVYIFKDRSDQIIYVGKAKNLKKRVLAYFKPSRELPHKTALMMNKAEGLDYFLTATEKEAFILEDTLVKRHMPRYNIILRDDKRYPCLRFDIQNPFPRLSIVRRIKKDGALYFGPFSSANSVRSTLKLIDKIFHLRKCKGRDLPNRSRPCLNYQLGRCLGACVHEVSSSAYNEIVDQVKLFLEGRNRELIRQLKKNMTQASENLDFERAARIRDQIRAVEATIERQHVVSPKMEDQDVIGLVEENGRFQVVILFVRKGYLLGSRDYLFRNKGASRSEIMEAFLKQYYAQESFIPKHILISESVEDLPPLKDWISDLAGKRVSVHHPKKGEKHRLVRMAVTNAEKLLSTRTEIQKDDLMVLAKSVLRLRKIPRAIEGLDISTLHGDQAVGTVVCFLDGLPHKSGYRNYKIKGIEGIDDYGMMSEVVSRRLSKGNPPDLFLVDGGKGHLLAAKKAMRNFHELELPEVVAIAKADERKKSKTDKIYIFGRKNPLSLSSEHPVLLLLMWIRDEAHRRAITYHRKLRGKRFKASELDQIPGIGPKKRKLLMGHFGDLMGVSEAKFDDLVLIPGISPSLAKNILTFFSERIKKVGA